MTSPENRSAGIAWLWGRHGLLYGKISVVETLRDAIAGRVRFRVKEIYGVE